MKDFLFSISMAGGLLVTLFLTVLKLGSGLNQTTWFEVFTPILWVSLFWIGWLVVFWFVSLSRKVERYFESQARELRRISQESRDHTNR